MIISWVAICASIVVLHFYYALWWLHFKGRTTGRFLLKEELLRAAIFANIVVLHFILSFDESILKVEQLGASY